MGNSLYHLTGDPKGWKLLQFDLETWEEIARTVIELGENEGANDQMLAYVNGMLVGSNGYEEDANGADTEGNVDTKLNPSVGIYTHHHAFSLDLNPIDTWFFQDIRHSNGTSMVFVDGTYYLVTSTAFFGDLMVLEYDENWDYVGAKILMEVAYLGIEGGGRSEMRLGIFDKDWQCQLSVYEVPEEF